MLEPKLRPHDHDLYAFDGKLVKPRGIIKLPLELGDRDNFMKQDTEFFVVDYWSPYNAITTRIFMFSDVYRYFKCY